jgi:hypothetical protein
VHTVLINPGLVPVAGVQVCTPTGVLFVVTQTLCSQLLFDAAVCDVHVATGVAIVVNGMHEVVT